MVVYNRQQSMVSRIYFLNCFSVEIRVNGHVTSHCSKYHGLNEKNCFNVTGPRPSAKNANNTGTATRPRPQPIAGTPPPDPNEKCDAKIIQQTCTLFGLDLVTN